MHFFVTEIVSTLEAVLILLSILIGSGLFFARLFRFPGFDEGSLVERLGIAILCGLACLPVLLDFAGRFGPLAMVALAAITSLSGLPEFLRKPAVAGDFPLKVYVAISFAWCLAITLMLVDWPSASGLVHSYLVVDYVKHATATWSIASVGTPPLNPAAFDPSGHAAYYYFFYTLTAVGTLIGSSLGIEARHAAFASSSCMGLALFALVYAVWKRAGTDLAPYDPRAARQTGLVIAALLFATGLDILPNLFIGMMTGGQNWLVDPEHWNTQITSWLSSVLWVPHHVAALCSVFVGFMALAAKNCTTNQPPSWRHVLLAALAFASMAGLSVYVAIGGALTAIVWVFTLLYGGRIVFAARVVIAGVLSLCLAAPWLLTLTSIVHSSGGPAPLAFAVRAFKLTDVVIEDEPLRSIVRLLLLPLSYGLEFGIFAIGTFVFWKRGGRKGWSSDLATILLIGTIIAFTVGTFVRSTIVNNDLGWRIMLFAQLAMLIWTLSVLHCDFSANPGLRRAALICLGLGYVFDAYTIMQLRLNSPFAYPQSVFLPDEIAGWEWLNRTLPKGSVVEERPDIKRAISYGLYGRFPQALADEENARLYGASNELVESRMAMLAPIFSDSRLSFEQVRTRAREDGVDALVLTARDPVFADPQSWVQSASPAYANGNVKIFLMTARANDK